MWIRSWLVAASLLLSFRVQAQEPSDPAHYQMLIDEGIREFGLHNFAEARSLLTRAHAHFPNARALRAIGMAEYELQNYAASAAALAASLASEVRPLDKLQRIEAEQLLTRAESFLTHVQVIGRYWPSAVYVDDELVQLAPGGELVLEAGEHLLSFERPGYLGERRQVRAVGSEWLFLRISLTPIFVSPI